MNDLESWLALGGDHRLTPDENGLNAYRTSCRPRTTAPLGSCTASSPSDLGWAEASAAFDRWRASEHADDQVRAMNRQTRAQLREVFGLGAQTAIALTPSGTDAIYLISAAALRTAEHVHHVVVGASELGGGTLNASRGLPFSEDRPFQDGTQPLEPIPGLAERCSAEPVYLRARSGERHDVAATDAQVEERVNAAVKPGVRVNVHLVAHSKTGLRAPSLELCKRLTERHGDQVWITVDAAQGRLAPTDIRTALEHGFVVLFTGSKFYAGPPFAGALFFPRNKYANELPDALDDWFDDGGVPWDTDLAEPVNPGLALRWRAAMGEIVAYHDVHPRHRARVYATFAGAVQEVLGAHASVDLDYPMPVVHELATGLAAFPSVFGFRVRGASGWLDKPTLKTLHRLLDSPIDAQDPVLARCYHLGQPVALGPPGEAPKTLLRVAVGAPLVTRFARAPDAGGAWFRQTMHGLLAKIDRVLQDGLLG